MSLIDLFSRISVSNSKSRRVIWRSLLLLPLFLPLSVCASYAHFQSFSHYDKHVDILLSWVGQTETHGYNRSPLIDTINRYVKAPLGSSYCAGTICRALYLSGNPIFKTALARNLRNKDTFTAFDVIMGNREILKGDLLVWQKGETIFGHVEAASEDWNGTKGKSVGGNTSPSKKGSQSDGAGFWEKTNSIEPTSYSRIKWITPIRK